MNNGIKRYRFSTMLLVAFLMLSVPTVALVVVYAYLESCRAAQQVLAYDVARGQQAITRLIRSFFGESVGAVEGLARIAEREPAFFRNQSGALALRGQLMGMRHLDTLSVTYEDGFTFGSLRANDVLKKRQLDTPAQTALLDFRITPSEPKERFDRRQFLVDQAGNILRETSSAVSFDPRLMPHYILARETARTSISDRMVNPDTGEHVIAVAAPITKDRVFQGAVSASVAISEIARFLYLHRITPETLIAIIDDSERVVVPPLSSAPDGTGVINDNLESALMRVEPRVSEAMRHVGDTSSAVTVESALIGGVTYSLSVAPIPNDFNLQWRLLIAAPENDFIGPLRRARASIAWLLVAIIPLQLLLIRGLSLRVSRGIVTMADNLRQIRLMNFNAPQKTTQLFTQEIAQLSEGITLLQSALRSFAQYIPIGVVRELIAKKKPLELGVEERKLTIMFTDLENFSTVSQSISPDQLLTQLSDIFSVMTSAVSEELGTVDKFIGDSVMAFWGAPTEVNDSPLRACRAALRITRRIDKLNERWRQEGKSTLRVRIGINYAHVLVGNIGTSERLSYTAIGDGVNVASRLEGVNKQFKTAICVSDRVRDEVVTTVVFRPLGEVSVKGRVGAFPVYEVLGVHGSADPELAVPATND